MKNLVAFLALFWMISAHAQLVQKVVLKNGSEITGTVVEENDKYVKIKTEIGNIWSFERSEIVSAVTVNPVVSGFYSRISVGVLGGSDVSASLHITNGFRINQHFGAGFGLGVENLVWGGYVPLFVQGEWHPFKGRANGLFLNVMGGYEMPLSNFEIYNGGPTAGAHIGLDLSVSHRVAITTTLGYRYAQISRTNTYWWGYDDLLTIREINRFELRLGILIK